ncbi:MAG: antitoxin [Chloroflexi bacterium]|nr:antitoxin [Chloroflexota bacterium]
MSMLDRRLRVLIDEDRWSRLEHEAARRGVAVAVLVREAIDERYPGDADERRRALQSLLDGDLMPVPDDPRQLRQALDASRRARSE